MYLSETRFYYSQATTCLPSNCAGEKKQEMEVHETKSLFELLLEHFSMAAIEPNLCPYF